MSNKVRQPSPLTLTDLRRIYSSVLSRDDPKPLKVGIYNDLLEAHPGQVSKRMLYTLLGQQTRSKKYLEAISNGGPRYGLDGTTVGVVTESERLFAFQRLEEIKAVRANEQAQQKHRSALLKEFEQSDVSCEEFATQKAIAVSEIHSALHKAQNEREKRHRQRQALMERFEKSGLSAEEFSKRKKVPLDRLTRAATKLGKQI